MDPSSPPPPGLEVPDSYQDEGHSKPTPQHTRQQLYDGWREWTEETIQANFEFLQAARQTDRDTSKEDDKGLHDILHAFHSWSTFLGLLRSLGFEPETECHWRGLGLDPTTVTTSAESLIEDRSERLRLLLGEALRRIPSNQRAMETIQQALAKTLRWRTQCREERAEAHAAANRRGTRRLNMLYEPPAGLEDALTLLAKQWERDAGRRWVSALWQTDVRDLLKEGSKDGILDPPDAQKLTELVLQGAKSALQAAADLPGCNIMLWMPREATQGGRLLAHLQAILTGGEGARKFLIVCERAPTTNSPPPELMMDFWKSPLRQDKWSHLALKVAHLKGPEYLTISTEGQIQQVLRSYTIVLVGGGVGAAPEITLTPWKRAIQGPEDTHVIQLEIPAGKHMLVRRTLHKLSEGNAYQWDGPARSPASRGQGKRLLFYIYAPRRLYTELGLHLLIGRLRKEQDLAGANIGPDSLGEMEGAKIIEMQSWAATEDVADLTQATLVISPTEALVATSAPQQAWEQRLTELHMADPKRAPRIMRWRHIKGHGVWARPRTLINMAPRGTSRPHPGRLYLLLQGSIGPNPPELLREIVRRIQEITGTLMQEQAPEDDLATNQWRPEMDIGGGLTGHIEMLVEDKARAIHFQDRLANLSVEVHQRTIPLLVTGDSLVAGTFRRS